MGLPTGQTKTIALISALLVAVLATVWISKWPDRAPLSQREIATRVLAEHLRKTLKPSSVVVISNPFSQGNGRSAQVYTFQKAGESGLRTGFGAEVNVQLGFPKLRPETLRDPGSVFVDPNTTTPLSYLVAENGFDDLIREHPQCDLFVSLIGLPANTATRPYWLQKAPPRFALLLPDFTTLGIGDAVRHAFKSGKIVAAVIPKPGVAPDTNATGADYKAEFDKRFILLTSENVDQFAPILFR